MSYRLPTGHGSYSDPITEETDSERYGPAYRTRAPTMPEIRQGRKRPSRQQALAPVPQQLPLPGRAFAPKCTFRPKVGRRHPALAPRHPYNLCVTPTQWKALWKKPYSPMKTQRLACGTFACVWPRDRNTVVKITNDQSDLQALKKANDAGLHKGPFAMVPKLYRAFRLKSETTSDEPVYGMIVERLRDENKLPRGLTSRIYCMRENAHFYEPKMLEEDCCGGATGVKKKMCRQMAEQVPNMLEEMDRLGIDTRDLHEGNIGYSKDGRWKILDLGLSGLPPAKRAAPTLRGARRRR